MSSLCTAWPEWPPAKSILKFSALHVVLHVDAAFGAHGEVEGGAALSRRFASADDDRVPAKPAGTTAAAVLAPSEGPITSREGGTDGGQEKASVGVRDNCRELSRAGEDGVTLVVTSRWRCLQVNQQFEGAMRSQARRRLCCSQACIETPPKQPM